MESRSQIERIRKQVRWWIAGFISLLALSGVTAFPLRWELSLTEGIRDYLPQGINDWIHWVNIALTDTDSKYPFLAYGTDWLAFAHLVIAVAFIGPFRDPVRNIWIIQFGMIACVMVLPLAFIAGPIRGIPFTWQLVDCSFGVFGIIPLYIIYKKIQLLELLTSNMLIH